MRRLVLTVIVAGALCVSCGAPPVVTDFDDSTAFTHSFDDVWTALIETFADYSWPIDTIEKDSGIITTDWLEIGGPLNERDLYADCGKDIMGTELTPWYLKFNVFVKETDAETVVRVNCHFKSVVDPSSGQATCASKGHLEGRIFAELNERLP